MKKTGTGRIRNVAKNSATNLFIYPVFGIKNREVPMVIKKRFMLPISLIIIFSISVLSGLSQTRDYWLKMERKGQEFGYEHLSVCKIENGQLEYRVEQCIKTDVAGLAPQDIMIKANYIVNADFEPISFSLHSQSRARDRQMSGKFSEEKMHVIVDDKEGNIRKDEISFQNTYFDIVLPDMILKREHEKAFEIKVFDPLSMRVNDIEVKITYSDADLLEASIAGVTDYRIDRSGRIDLIQIHDLNMKIYRTDAEQAQEISHLSTSGGFSLSTHSRQFFPNVLRVASAQLEIKWKNLPFEAFHFDDNRQKVLNTSEVNGEYSAVVEIKKISSVSEKISAPVVDKSFSRFLGDTEYIKPGDPSIQQKSAEIRGRENDSFSIVQRLLSWVSNNIKTDIFAETLTGPEVLRIRRGKCSEYAILFASLARATGIPTKVVLGVGNRGNQWIGHIWNEVWLGEWVAVDPTSGIFVSGPTQVKFVDSPAITGLNQVRIKLIDNLSIDILDFTEEEEEYSNTYLNQAFAFKISRPNSAWEIIETQRSGQIVVTVKPKQQLGVRFEIVLYQVTEGASAEAILNERINWLAGIAKGFNKIVDDRIELLGHKVPRIIFLSDYNSITLVSENWMLVEGNRGYLFKFISPQSCYEEYKPIAQKILDSFETVNK